MGWAVGWDRWGWVAQLDVGYQTPFGFVGSLESQSTVTICGSSKATEEMLIVSLAIAPDGCVELRTAEVLFWTGIPSSDEGST